MGLLWPLLFSSYIDFLVWRNLFSKILLSFQIAGGWNLLTRFGVYVMLGWLIASRICISCWGSYLIGGHLFSHTVRVDTRLIFVTGPGWWHVLVVNDCLSWPNVLVRIWLNLAKPILISPMTLRNNSFIANTDDVSIHVNICVCGTLILTAGLVRNYWLFFNLCLSKSIVCIEVVGVVRVSLFWVTLALDSSRSFTLWLLVWRFILISLSFFSFLLFQVSVVIAVLVC